MTFTGIVRHVDRLGRIVLPKKLRQALGLKELTDPIEIYLDGSDIILKKFTEGSSVSGDLRCLDKFGRIVIPIAVRELLGIESQKDFLEIYCENDNIILRKFEPVCIFCGESEKLTAFKGKKICANCLNELKR